MDNLTIFQPSTIKGKKWNEPEKQLFFLFDDILACEPEIQKKSQAQKDYSVLLKNTWVDDNYTITCT
jgi:hypothetical protein